MIKSSLLGATTALALMSVSYAGGVTIPQVEPAPVVTTVATIPAYDWSGGYAGLIFATNTADTTTGDITTTEDPLAVIPGISYSSSGVSAGLEAGYNFQSNALVYGVEIDASTAAVDGSLSNFLDTGPGTNFSVSTNAEWIASARGRLGFASGRALFYVTGGVAEASLQTQLTDTYNGGATVFTPSVSETRSGWVAGAGAEFALKQNRSLKVEYLHYDFGSKTASFVEGTDRTISTDATYTDNQARIGFNYHF